MIGDPEIIYAGITLDFPENISAWVRGRPAMVSQDLSAGGVSGAVFEHAFDEVEIEALTDDRDFFRDFQAFYSHAAQKKEFSFALHNDDKIDTTLDASAASGQKDIPLTSTTDIQVGTFYRLRADNATKEEIIKVASVDPGVKVTAVDNLKFSYDSGDFFRSEDFFPRVILVDSDIPLKETEFGTFDLKMTIREVK